MRAPVLWRRASARKPGGLPPLQRAERLSVLTGNKNYLVQNLGNRIIEPPGLKVGGIRWKAYELRHMEQNGMAKCHSFPCSKLIFPVLALGFLVAFLGCDSGGSLGTVNGTVTYRGQPLTG